GGNLEPRIDLLRDALGGEVALLRQILECDALRAVDGVHHAIGDGQFLDRHLEQERANDEDALAQLAGSLDGRAAAKYGGPRCKCTEAVGGRSGVIRDACDVLEPDTKLV